jgi:hypothetical protein
MAAKRQAGANKAEPHIVCVLVAKVLSFGRMMDGKLLEHKQKNRRRGPRNEESGRSAAAGG